jgi:peptidoglycan hydrolase CwlO-like protein
MAYNLHAKENDEVSELRYEYEKRMRLRDSLQKNLERRKKLGLSDKAYERQLTAEIEEIERDMNDYKKQVKTLEARRIRSQNIDEKQGF